MKYDKTIWNHYYNVHSVLLTVDKKEESSSFIGYGSGNQCFTRSWGTI